MHAKQTIKIAKPLLKVSIEFCCTYHGIPISLWPSSAWRI